MFMARGVFAVALYCTCVYISIGSGIIEHLKLAESRKSKVSFFLLARSRFPLTPSRPMVSTFWKWL